MIYLNPYFIHYSIGVLKRLYQLYVHNWVHIRAISNRYLDVGIVNYIYLLQYVQGICGRIEYSFLEYSILYQSNSEKVNEI